jgi:hypothetical protein
MDYRRYFDDNQDIIEELKQNPANEILKVDTSVRVRRT